MVGPSYKENERLISAEGKSEEKNKRKSRHRVNERADDMSESGQNTRFRSVSHM